MSTPPDAELLPVHPVAEAIKKTAKITLIKFLHFFIQKSSKMRRIYIYHIKEICTN